MSTLEMLAIFWGAVTAVLLVALIYRSNLETREEDQLFLDPAEETMASEQRAILAKIEKLNMPIKGLWALSGGLLLVIAGIWVWRGFQNF